MKYLLLLCLIVFVSSQANLANLDCDYVPQKLVLQRDLQVNYFADVTRAQGICDTEFSAYGTCCSTDSLRAKASSLQASLTSSISSIKAEYASFSDAVQNIDQRLQELANGKEHNFDDAYNNKIEIGEGIYNSRAWFFMKNNFANSSQQLVNFNTSMDNCWATVSSFRNSSMCTMCSGRSQAFVTNVAGSQIYQVVASNTDCQNAANQCLGALKLLRTFSQGLQIYTKYITPVLLSTLAIFSDDHKVNKLRLARLNEFLTSQRLAENINATDFNLENGRAGVCNAIMSAGKPTLVEAMVQIFQPNASYGVYDLNGPLTDAELQAVLATDSIEDILSAGISSSVANPITSGDSSNISSELDNVVARLKGFEMSRRRRLQGGDSTFLDSNTLQSYLDELRSIVGGRGLESVSLTPTPIKTGSDEFGGDLVERYISGQLSVVSASGYQLLSGGLQTRPYDNPPADNPPAFMPLLFDPIMLTPSTLTL